MDIEHGDALRARPCEREPAHGQRKALRTDQRVELHRVRIMHRQVQRHDAVAAGRVGERLCIVS